MTIDFLHRVHRGHGQVGVHGPYGLSHLIQEAFISRTTGVNDEIDGAHGVRAGLPRIWIGHKGWPVNDCRRFFIDTVVANILDNADDLLPWRVLILLHALADGGGGRTPGCAREILRYEHVFPHAINIGPGKIAARHKTRSDGMEVAGRNVVIELQRRVTFVTLSFYINQVPVWVDAFHGYGRGKANR